MNPEVQNRNSRTGRRRLPAAVGVCLAMVCGPALAAAVRQVELLPTDDTYTLRGTPDTVYGAETRLFIKRSSAGSSAATDRAGYLRFDTAGIAPADIASASLLLSITDGAGVTAPFSFRLYGFSDGHPDEAFDEETLTFNTADSASATLPGSFDAAGAVLLGTFAAPSLDVPYTVDFNATALRDFLNANANSVATLAVLRETPDALPTTFKSKEEATATLRPALLLYTPGDAWSVAAVSASSTLDGDPANAAANAADDDFRSRWTAAPDTADAGNRAHVILDLGTARAVNELDFVAYQHGRSYRLESSANGSSWTIVDDAFPSGSGTAVNVNRLQTRRLFPAVTARYFRLTSLTTTAGQSLSLWEVQLRYEVNDASLRARHDTLTTAVAALPADTPARRLHKALLEWGLEDTLLDLEVADLDAAGATLDDVEAALASVPSIPAAAFSNLFPAVPDAAANFLFQKSVSDATADMASAATWVRGQTFDPRGPALDARTIIHAMGHPQSPASLQDQAAGFKAFLRRVEAVYNLAAVSDLDYFAKSDLGLAYLLYRTRYPSLILPSKQAKWDAILYDINIKEANATRGRTVSNVNQEALKWLMMTCAGLYFNDADMLDVADERMGAFAAVLFPDGAFPYSGLSNEANEYQYVDLQQIYYYGVLTGDPRANDLIRRSRWYFPVTMRRGPMAEWNTSHVAKDRWNGVSGKEGAYMVASLTGCPHNYRTAVDGGLNFGDLFTAPLYRSDLVRAEEPDDWTTFDRNIRGIRGRDGDFSFWINGNTSHEINSLAGCMILNAGTSLGFTCNAAVAKIGSYIRSGTGVTFAAPDSREINMAELGDAHLLDTITTPQFGSVASVNGLTDDFYGTPLPGWTAREQWLASPAGLTGLVAVEATGPAGSYGVGGLVKLFSYRVAGVRKTWQALDADTWAYGRLRVRIHEHNYSDVITDYAFVQDWDGSEAKLGAGRLLLRDAAAIVTDAHAADPVNVPEPAVTSYAAGYRRYHLVEIYPDTSAPSDQVQVLSLPGGLIGWESLRAAEGRRYRMVHNPGDVDVAYSAVVDWPGNFRLHRSGETYRAPWLEAFDTSIFTDPRGPLRSGHTDAVRILNNRVDVIIPARGHIVLEGIPDLAPETSDDDGDGATNADEYTAGTDPTRAGDVFRLGAFGRDGAGYRFTLPGRAGRTYRIERSTTLEPVGWETIFEVSGFPADGVIDFSDPAPPHPRVFYRAAVTYP